MEIKRAIDCGVDIREKLSEVYVNAFYDDVLKYFSKDKAKLKKAFAHGFVLEHFYVAIIDNEIAGMIACMGKGQFCFKIKMKTLIENLGIFKGLFTNFEFNQFRNESPKLDKKTALIEYVATSEKHLNEGVATTLVKYLFTLPEYDYYIVEAVGTNTKAVGLYRKLGFRAEYMKIFIGAAYIGMKYTKEHNNGINYIKTMPLENNFFQLRSVENETEIQTECPGYRHNGGRGGDNSHSAFEQCVHPDPRP